MAEQIDKQKEQHFIYFENKVVGKTYKVRLNISSLVKYCKKNSKGEYIFDFFIAKRKKIINGKVLIAWTEFDPIDNTDLVGEILGISV